MAGTPSRPTDHEPPHLWILAGPNGAGKSTYYETVVRPIFNAPFVNADLIARREWPDDPDSHVREAQQEAFRLRDKLLGIRRSLVYESVFSHPSKVDFIRRAKGLGYTVWMTFVSVGSDDLAIARVGQRMQKGGHPVPVEKVRARYLRSPKNVLDAIADLDKLIVVDNSARGNAYVNLLRFTDGRLTWQADAIPAWARTMFRGFLN